MSNTQAPQTVTDALEAATIEALTEAGRFIHRRYGPAVAERVATSIESARAAMKASITTTVDEADLAERLRTLGCNLELESIEQAELAGVEPDLHYLEPITAAIEALSVRSSIMVDGEVVEALKRACSALNCIANEFADPEEIAAEPEAFGGPDDGDECVRMAYENMQGTAARCLADIKPTLDALLARLTEGER